ncbi:hypothetical protein VB10N_44650 [Vibrio sp. 10N]|nr:hypothetical protein VB10N_44650 [Vibrio sp. 10N]
MSTNNPAAIIEGTVDYLAGISFGEGDNVYLTAHVDLTKYTTSQL